MCVAAVPKNGEANSAVEGLIAGVFSCLPCLDSFLCLIIVIVGIDC